MSDRYRQRVPSGGFWHARYENCPPISHPIGPVDGLTGAPTVAAFPVTAKGVRVSASHSSSNLGLEGNRSSSLIAGASKAVRHLPTVSTRSNLPLPSSGLPRSRTLNVISTFTQPFSRGSLVPRLRNSQPDKLAAATSSKRYSSSGLTPLPPRPSLEVTNESSTETEQPRSGADNKSGSPSVPVAATVVETYNNPRYVHTAQPSEYWAGRFTALRDRFHSEVLYPSNLATLVAAHAERSRKGQREVASVLAPPGDASAAPQPTAGLPRSQTLGSVLDGPLRSPAYAHHYPVGPTTPRGSATRGGSEAVAAAATRSREVAREAALLADEDNRCARAFLHLGALCVTAEARRSLWHWQQAYARRVGKPCLLPDGGRMEDKGFVSRLFSSGKRKEERVTSSEIPTRKRTSFGHV